MWRQGDHCLVFPSAPRFGCTLVTASNSFFTIKSPFFSLVCGPLVSLIRYSFFSAAVQSPKVALSSSETSFHNIDMFLLREPPFLQFLIA